MSARSNLTLVCRRPRRPLQCFEQSIEERERHELADLFGAIRTVCWKDLEARVGIEPA